MATAKRQQPESLSSFAEAAREEKVSERKPGLTADSETKPIPTDPKLKHDAATKVLREGVLHKDQGADEAIDKLPDRIMRE
ncbi:hypothetical protein [Aestuariivirga sp.]|uniref:hypothetical protein n=1 Tax=Aestuariivirga sp. TaxID=2650926 RepID=UPI0039E3DCF1